MFLDEFCNLWRHKRAPPLSTKYSIMACTRHLIVVVTVGRDAAAEPMGGLGLAYA
jgi:hypothetical protein